MEVQSELPKIQEQEQASEIEVEAVPMLTSPPLRRSTRERRAPDRLNLWIESPSCFMLDKGVYGMGDMAQDSFTYLTDALCQTTPPITQASSIVSSDAFKASVGDPDTLSWDQAMNDTENLDKWMEAALKEISALERHGTWEVVDATEATSKILPRVSQSLFSVTIASLYSVGDTG